MRLYAFALGALVVALHALPAKACLIVIDWDHTANCSWNIFNPSPCEGFCAALRGALQYCAAQGSTPTLCDGSRRSINPNDWSNLMGDCGFVVAYDGSPGVHVTPPNQDGCPDVRWPKCWTPACRNKRVCESMGPGEPVGAGPAVPPILIDGDCPNGGFAACYSGKRVSCCRPGPGNQACPL
jgi:hypothetical protein